MNPRFRTLVAVCIAGAAASLGPPTRSQYNCAGISEASNTALVGQVVASGLSAPVFVAAPPGDANRIFIVELAGRIRIHKRGQPAVALQTFLDIRARVDDTFAEMGLLGLAFDPDYATTRRFWVHYTDLVEQRSYTVLARYTASVGNADVADPTEVRLFRVLQPGNHNSGMIAFGPDGFLYVGKGDGGGAGDEHGECGNGQDRSVLLGKILRLDVRGIDPEGTPPDCGLEPMGYTVPRTNPFGDGPGGVCDEIWAYGLRNPWRWSFDALTGDLYIGDVGQNCTEELNFAPSTSAGGENYGWRQMEGSHCFDVTNQADCDPSGAICPGSPPCHDPSITLPVAEYSHVRGCSVTGGFVYRGCRMPNYRGRYFYGDYCMGETGSFVMSGGVATDPIDMTAQVGVLGGLSSFGTDAQGEIYAVEIVGFVRKLVPPFVDLEVSGLGAGTPLSLSKTGNWTWENLFVSTDVPVTFYRVYRGPVGGPYGCVFRTRTPSWPAGGDPTVPAVGELFAYLVTAVAHGQETLPGTSGAFSPAPCVSAPRATVSPAP